MPIVQRTSSSKDSFLFTLLIYFLYIYIYLHIYRYFFFSPLPVSLTYLDYMQWWKAARSSRWRWRWWKKIFFSLFFFVFHKTWPFRSRRVLCFIYTDPLFSFSHFHPCTVRQDPRARYSATVGARSRVDRANDEPSVNKRDTRVSLFSSPFFLPIFFLLSVPPLYTMIGIPLSEASARHVDPHEIASHRGHFHRDSSNFEKQSESLDLFCFFFFCSFF